MGAVNSFLQAQYKTVTPQSILNEVLCGKLSWADWRAKTTADLRDILGRMAGLGEFNAEVEWTRSMDGYEFSKIFIMTEETLRTPFYLLTPHKKLPNEPAVLAIHGHGYGVKDIVALMPDGTDRTGDPGYHKDFAVALAKRGFTVLAPELLGFGEMRTDEAMKGHPNGSSCMHISGALITIGRTMIGVRVQQCMSVLDYAIAEGLISKTRIGAMGISGGGMVGTYLTALEPRISAAVLSGYPCTYEGCVWAMNHCSCNYMPGMLERGEMYDFLSLIAPRPMLWESASEDPIFPRPAVIETEEIIRQVYAAQNASANFEVDYFEGKHEIHGVRAYEFLKEHL